MVMLAILGCAPLPQSSMPQKLEPPQADTDFPKRLNLQMQQMGISPDHMPLIDGFVVLGNRPPENWTVGTPDTLATQPSVPGHPNTAFRPVRLIHLPSAIAKLPGTRLQLLDAQGAVCAARITEILMLAQSFTSNPYETFTNREEIAQDIWEESETEGNPGRFLGARITPLSETCEKATWARVN